MEIDLNLRRALAALFLLYPILAAPAPPLAAQIVRQQKTAPSAPTAAIPLIRIAPLD